MLSGWTPVAPDQQGPRGGNEQRSTHRRASDGNKVLGRTTYWAAASRAGFPVDEKRIDASAGGADAPVKPDPVADDHE